MNRELSTLETIQALQKKKLELGDFVENISEDSYQVGKIVAVRGYPSIAVNLLEFTGDSIIPTKRFDTVEGWTKVF